MNEKTCAKKILYPNGLFISVAKAINGGDFQIYHLCEKCPIPCDDLENI